jgi:hypothetical protein
MIAAGACVPASAARRSTRTIAAIEQPKVGRPSKRPDLTLLLEGVDMHLAWKARPCIWHYCPSISFCDGCGLELRRPPSIVLVETGTGGLLGKSAAVQNTPAGSRATLSRIGRERFRAWLCTCSEPLRAVLCVELGSKSRTPTSTLQSAPFK